MTQQNHSFVTGVSAFRLREHTRTHNGVGALVTYE